MRESLMYKMSYYRFNDLYGGRPGMDRVRGSATATVGPHLDYLDEAFTSENWIVRTMPCRPCRSPSYFTGPYLRGQEE